MKIIAKIKFGSHLYGTSTPQSDLDIKGVYIPCARDILLQQVTPMISQSRPKKEGEKNTSEDVDYELYSLQRYLELLSEGQTVALDMLFAPDWAMMEPPSPVWEDVKKLAPRIFTKGSLKFVKYCRQQANKYGIKGSRVAASRLALTTLEKAEQKYGAKAKLECASEELSRTAASNPFLKIIESQDGNGAAIRYFDVCGKKAMFSASIQKAKEVAQKLVNEYGHRALAAERNEGVDWKALSHAIRVGYQAIEFFSSHKMTFPRPEAEHLLAIKQGKVDYPKVAEEIEDLLDTLEKVALASTLPDSIDSKIIENFVVDTYAKQVTSHG